MVSTDKEIIDMPSWHIVYPRHSSAYIPRRVRAGSIQGGKKLYNCDVCWTCKSFDCINYVCNRYPNDRHIPIDWPEAFRCTYWKETE